MKKENIIVFVVGKNFLVRELNLIPAPDGLVFTMQRKAWWKKKETIL